MPTITSVTKYFPKAKEGFTTTLSSTIASGATTVNLNSVTGYSNGDTVVLVVDPGNSAKQVFTGVIDTAGVRVTGVNWTEGTNVTHTSGATVVDYVTATHMSMVSTGMLKSHNPDGSLKTIFDVTAATYGAVGDGTTDDSTAIQAAITACLTAGGGTVFFPSGKTYKMTTGISIDPATLTATMNITGYGAKISYTGSSDAFVILTNIVATDNQHAERSVNMEGLYIVGTSAATAGLRVKSSFSNFRNMVFEGFTSITSQSAAIVLDGLFHFWVEECHFENIDIKNTGNGICFISRDEVGGVPASIENNYFTNVHIWVAVAAGKGLYGVGLGASTICLISRSAFYGIIVHIVNVANVIAFDFNLVAVEGVVMISPGVDVFTAAATSTGFRYAYSSILTILGFTNYPNGSLTNITTGGGGFLFMGNGNAANLFQIDNLGNVKVPTLTMLGDIYDANGKKVLEIGEGSVSAVNNLQIQNSPTTAAPTLKVTGTDTDISMNIQPKGSGGGLYMLDHNSNELMIFGPGTASAVNELTIKNAATANNPLIQVSGGDTNAGLDISTKGTGAVTLYSGSKARKLAIFNDAASAVNWLSIVPTGTGVGASLTVDGETNVDLQLYGKGTGYVKIPQKFGIASSSATPAGGTTGLGMQMGTTSNLGLFFGSGAPTLSAAQGSLYIRSDGSSTSTRLYVNTNGTTGWTNVTTAT